MNKLQTLVYPKSIALIGASRDKDSVGFGIATNLLKGGTYYSVHNKPYKHKTYFVNPFADNILGKKCYRSILKIKERIDLAIIAVPASAVLEVVKECVKKKVGSIILISAGFAEIDQEGKNVQDELVRLAKEHNINMLGPNCLGVINTSLNLNATFAPSMPPKGKIAFISQSGALIDSIIDWSVTANYGFSKIISTGNAAMLDVSDFINYLSKDTDTEVIAIYLENIKDGKKFFKAMKSCTKPVIILKGGKTEKSTKAVMSHTGALAGKYEIYKAAFRQAGAIIAEDIEDLFGYAKILCYNRKLKSNRIAIITNGGGCGVIAADEAIAEGFELPPLSAKTKKTLSDSKYINPANSRSNPLDLVGDAVSESYRIALNTVLSQKDIDGVIVIQTLQTMTDSYQNAKVIYETSKKFKKPIISVFMGGKHTQPGRDYLRSKDLPVYDYPHKAVKMLKALLK